MCWDSLTVAGVCLSILTTAGAFYLVLRDRPRVPKNTTPG